MPSIADRVKETTTTTGTGTVSLGGAVTGFRAFSSAFASGTAVYYCITDGTNWEVGYGAATTGTPWTLARTTVLASSNAGALVSFGAGTKDVFCTAPAAEISNASEILPITCTQSGGALTFTLNPCVLDFRSTTLTTGVPVTRTVSAPITLTVPSGGTLGSVTTIAANLIPVAIDNAGTVELAVINLAGGNALDETGIINTTAVSAASTSSTVFYSTTARTGVVYRVVGSVTAVNTAGAWDNPTLVQGVGGLVLPGVPQLRLSTSVATTSGTSIDFTSIPAWVKRITVMFSGVSTNGTSQYLVQIGDAGGIENTGYIGQANNVGGMFAMSAGFIVQSNVVAANTHHGIFTLSRLDSTTWAGSGILANQAATYNSTFSAGSKILSATLDRIRLTTANGTDTFDAGSINILYEG